MHVITEFTLTKKQLKEALEQWLNACVLKAPCKIKEFDISYHDIVTVKLQEIPKFDPTEFLESPPPPDEAFPEA